MANPVLRQKDFENDMEYMEAMTFSGGESMTVNGTLQVTGFLGLITLAGAVYTWTRFTLGYTDLVNMLITGGAIVGLVLAVIISFSRLSPQMKHLRYMVPVYALCEGFVLGGISAVTESVYPGIVSTAIAGTFAALFSMLILYRVRIIACTQKFRAVVLISMFSVLGIYIVDIIGHIFGLSVPVIYSSNPYGIVFSIIIVVIAALNLIIDFDYIETAAARYMPKDYEWYGAFGLMVTLIWLYLEILRLLVKIQGSRR